MSDQRPSDFGEHIMELFSDAVKTQDFSDFNKALKGTIESTISSVNQEKKVILKSCSDEIKEEARKVVSDIRTQVQSRPTATKSHNIKNTVQKQPQKAPIVINPNPKGKILHIIYFIFGAFLVAFGACTAFIAVISAFASIIPLTVFFAIFSAVILWGGISLLHAGSVSKTRLCNFHTYCRLLSGRTYALIEEFASAIHRSPKYVVKDLKQMISLGMFPQGHIDAEETTFILDHMTYKQYLNAKQITETKRKQQEALANQTPEERAWRETYELGQTYIKKLREANDEIPGEIISNKLFHLESTIQKIFDSIKSHPTMISELRRFLDYYLPTTIKLVETYRDLDKQTLAGPNILKAKTEIDQCLDTINLAFDKLFDDLFAKTAMDVSADISVLHTMLAKEGLTQTDSFSKVSSK